MRCRFYPSDTNTNCQNLLDLGYTCGDYQVIDNDLSDASSNRNVDPREFQNSCCKFCDNNQYINGDDICEDCMEGQVRDRNNPNLSPLCF